MGMIKGAAGRGSSGAGAGGGGLAGGATLKDLGPMLKIWVYMEARSWLLNVAEGNTVEAFMRYDWLTPNV